MNQNHTDITIVLDRSGSMAAKKEDTIGGFNTFLRGQKEAPGTADITVHQFDDVFETPLPTSPIKSAKELDNTTFVPRGNTALYDAVGRAIVETGARLEKKPDHERAGKVVMVIITDGQENASREYSHTKLQEMISHQRDKYAWEFVFLGADIATVEVAIAAGIPATHAMHYADNAVGTQAMYSSASANLSKMRSGTKRDMSWEKQDIAAQVQAGLND